jgi:hypothetical protein
MMPCRRLPTPSVGAQAERDGIPIARSLDRGHNIFDLCRPVEQRGEIRNDVAPERLAGSRGHERNDFGERPASHVLGSKKFLEHRVRKSDFAWRPLGQKTNGFRINGE